MDIKEAFANAYKSPEVQDVLEKYNTWRDSKSNPLSKSTNDFVQNSDLIPQAIKEKYTDFREVANGATMGLAGSDVLTKGIRYGKFINKGIDAGIALDDKVTEVKQDVKEKIAKANDKIDDKVFSKKDDFKVQGPGQPTGAGNGMVGRVNGGIDSMAFGPEQPSSRGNEDFFNQIQENGKQMEEDGYVPKALRRCQ